MRVEIVSDFSNDQINKYLLTNDKSLLYYSSDYYSFLKKFLGTECHYFIAYDNNDIVGLLPFSIKRNNKFGNVLNSSPFYGSNGGAVYSENTEVLAELVTAFDNYAVQHKCVASTLITSPFESRTEWYDNNYGFTFKDQRIGQITPLPPTKEQLMGIFHFKTRNTVRKAIKGLSKVEWQNGLNYLDFIFETHKENLTAINGLYKPYSFFTEVADSFKYGQHLKIYIGFDENDQPIAGLLNLYFNNTVEYFCPVTVSEYREKQPLSGVIYQAMMDAIDDHSKWWNWGGTWLSQGGVYNFKSRWGTKDLNYFYYTKVYSEDILNCSSKVLLEEYPYFFVAPFSKLTSA